MTKPPGNGHSSDPNRGGEAHGCGSSERAPHVPSDQPLDPIYHRVLAVMDKEYGPSVEFWHVGEAIYYALSDAYKLGQESAQSTAGGVAS